MLKETDGAGGGTFTVTELLLVTRVVAPYGIAGLYRRPLRPSRILDGLTVLCDSK